MLLKAIIFDMDGTLANTLPVCFKAIRKALLEFTGRTYTDDEIVGLFGPSEKGICKRLVPDRWEECYRMLVDEYDRWHTLCTEPFPGITRLLKYLRQHGLKLAIVTGKGHETAEISLRCTGIAPYFHAIESGSETGSVKPEQITGLLHEWGIPNTEAAYVGDSPTDVRDAKKAGVLPLAAAWTDQADSGRLQESGPAAVFLTVDDMIDWLRKNAGLAD